MESSGERSGTVDMAPSSPAAVAVEEFKQGVPPPGMGLLRKEAREQRGERERETNRDNNSSSYYGDHSLREMNMRHGGGRDRDRGGNGYGRGGRNVRRGGGGSYRGGRNGERGERERHHTNNSSNRPFRLEGVVQSFENVSLGTSEGAKEGGEEEGKANENENINNSGGMTGWITSTAKFRGAREERFQFKEEDVMGGKGHPKLAVGDRVEFYRFVDTQNATGETGGATTAPRATRVRALDRKQKKTLHHQDRESSDKTGGSSSVGGDGNASNQSRFHIGVVVTLKETYGFLLSFRTGCQFFFHFSEFIGSSRASSHLPPPELQIGTVVRFILAQNPATGKDIGKRLCLMAGDGRPVFSVQEAEKRLVGKLVKRPSDLALPEDYGDGLIEFTMPSATEGKDGGEGGEDAKKEKEKDQKIHRAIVSKKQLNESHVHMEENDLVYFDCYRTENVDLAIAKDVVLMKKPHENFDSSKRELGVISVLKGSFGFITCTERMADVFLHLSQIPDVPKEELSVGTDVEFSVNRGAESGRLQAVDIKLAEKGSAVFEEVDEEVCKGTVLERLPNKKKASHSSLLVTGLIEGLVKGKLEKLPYMYNDLDKSPIKDHLGNKMGRNPRQGDKVTFQVVVDLKREKAARQAGRPGLGRRATAVALIIREGTVVATKGSFGFIEYQKLEDEIADASADADADANSTEDKSNQSEGPGGVEEAALAKEDTETTAKPKGEDSKKEETEAKEVTEKSQTEVEEKEKEKTENAETEKSTESTTPAPVADKKKESAASSKSRIFFHVSEVFDMVKLHLGDTVEFTICMNSRTQELNATRIKRTKEAVRIAKPPVKIEERPDHLKEFSVGSVGSVQVASLGRFAKGPDGTRGFSREYQMSRGKTFPVVEEEKKEEAEKVKKEEEEEGLKTSLSLNVEAAPFVPRAAK